jgi:hypothetical protein
MYLTGTNNLNVIYELDKNSLFYFYIEPRSIQKLNFTFYKNF